MPRWPGVILIVFLGVELDHRSEIFLSKAELRG
jgi:hypothetical protein